VLTVGSLFSGIGGFDLGLERAGMRTAWFCEQDEFCRRVLAKHWPGVPCYPDVSELRGADIEPVDVICGGFPCQDLSYAGDGAGLDGARSGLWSEYARLVGEIRPRYVVVENVAALLARGLGTVLRDLAAVGYDAEWDCIPASAVGAPHRRDRIWLVAYPDGSGRLSRLAGLQEGQPDAEGCSTGSDPHQGRREGGTESDGEPQRSRLAAPQRDDADRLRDDVADAQGARLEGTGLPGRPAVHGGTPRAVGDPEGDGRGQGRSGRPDPTGEGQRESERSLQDADERALQPWRVGGRAAQAGGPEWWAVEPPVGRVAHGVPDRLDQLASLGNALVPQIAEWIGRRIVTDAAFTEEMAA
jgi:DNA (cytosine-5)-methyltransferase 1